MERGSGSDYSRRMHDTTRRKVAAVAALSAAIGGAFAGCTCEPKKERGDTAPLLTASASPSGSVIAASVQPSAVQPTGSAEVGPLKFIRQRPEERLSADACAYLGFMGFACLEAMLVEKDPVVRRYMRRMSDADARIAKDDYTRGEAPGVPHAELSTLCAERGPCGQKDENGSTLDDGYACLTKAQLLVFQGDKLEAVEAHKRACKCGAARAEIPIMGGFLACDGPAKPAERGGNLTLSEAKNIRACAACDAQAGPAACAREIVTLKTTDAELARYIEAVHVPRCQKP